jgi:hypothetical protein
MAFKIPDVLKYEIRHRLENLGGGTTEGGVRGWINAHPLLAAGVAAVSAVSLIVVLASSLWGRSDAPRTQVKTVWFCDTNTGKLFIASPKKAGPIAAPSGPGADGEPAGFRARVYSYVRDPNQAQLFVGFLERPDPEAERKYSTADLRDFDRWTQGHLIRRLKDKRWVPAGGPEGQAILQETIKPNRRGQTPIHQVPRD